MKHIAAYALLVLGGKDKPSAADVEKVLTAAGLKGDEGKVAELVDKLKDKAFHEIVGEGLAKMSSMGTAAPSQSAGAADTKQEAKKEEVVEEEDFTYDHPQLLGEDHDMPPEKLQLVTLIHKAKGSREGGLFK